MLPDLQDSAAKTFQGEISPEKFHRPRLCRKAVGVIEAFEFLFNTRQGTNEALLHHL